MHARAGPPAWPGLPRPPRRTSHDVVCPQPHRRRCRRSLVLVSTAPLNATLASIAPVDPTFVSTVPLDPTVASAAALKPALVSAVLPNPAPVTAAPVEPNVVAPPHPHPRHVDHARRPRPRCR